MGRAWSYRKWLSKSQAWGILIFFMTALLHQFIANDAYILASTDAGVKVFHKGDVHWGIRAPIPYSQSHIDKSNRLSGPFDSQDVASLYYRHWLGTDDIGRDVLAGLIHGSYIALQVGFLSICISLLIGILLSYLSGYFGDSGCRVEKVYLVPAVIVSMVSLFYILYSRWFVSLLLLIFLVAMWYYLVRRPGARPSKTIGLPLDLFILRVIDIIDSMPALFLVLILLNLFSSPSIFNVILVIAFMRWPVVTRHLRAEILKLKEEDYILAAKSIGQKDRKIFLRHILPMAVSPIVIVSAFGFAAAVLTESTLSFLGIGVPLDMVSWGSLIKQARFHFDAWWLAFFPGMAIYGVVILFNSIGARFNKRIRGYSEL